MVVQEQQYLLVAADPESAKSAGDAVGSPTDVLVGHLRTVCADEGNRVRSSGHLLSEHGSGGPLQQRGIGQRIPRHEACTTVGAVARN
jgi:hypothetical protein